MSAYGQHLLVIPVEFSEGIVTLCFRLIPHLDKVDLPDRVLVHYPDSVWYSISTHIARALQSNEIFVPLV